MLQRIQTNLVAVIECARAVLPTMLRQKAGQIINVASIAGLIATPSNPVYCASKHGVVGFSEALRRDLLGTGVRVSCFCPGFTPSEISPMLQERAEGKPGRYIPGLMPVAYVAERIAKLIRHPRRLVVIPPSWRVLVWLANLCPWLVDLVTPVYKRMGRE